MSNKKRKKNPRGKPQWQPIAKLPTFTMVIDGQVDALEEAYNSLDAARNKPHVLDDAVVEHAVKVHTKILDDAWLYEEQLARWEKESLTKAQAQEVERLKGQMAKYRETCKKIIELAQELKKGSIDSILRMSDEEIAMAVMTGKLKLPNS
jgi:hypothetical protein